MTDRTGSRGDPERGQRPHSDGDGTSEWPSNRERVTYEEGRRVLEAQQSDIDDVDDKALRTVRIAALLLGVGATGARVIGVSNVNGLAAALSLSSFFVSLLFGVLVYNESDEVAGPTAEYLGRMRRDDAHARWELDLLVQFEGWIDSNREVVAFNSYLLAACQTFFVLGVGFGVASLLSLNAGAVTVGGSFLVVFVLTTLLVVRGLVRQG